MMRRFSGLLASGNIADAMMTPASVCVAIRPILKYLVILLVVISSVVIVSVFNDCKVIVRFSHTLYFRKCAAYLGFILDKGNITSISAVLK